MYVEEPLVDTGEPLQPFHSCAICLHGFKASCLSTTAVAAWLSKLVAKTAAGI